MMFFKLFHGSFLLFCRVTCFSINIFKLIFAIVLVIDYSRMVVLMHYDYRYLINIRCINEIRQTVTIIFLSGVSSFAIGMDGMKITLEETDSLIALLLSENPKPDTSSLKPMPTALVRVPMPVPKEAEEGSLKRSTVQVQDFSSWLPAPSYFSQQLMYHDRLLFKKVLYKTNDATGCKKGRTSA